MSDKEKSPEQQEEKAPVNSQFTIVFQRDTGRIADFQPINIDPFQLWGAAEWLKGQAHRMIAVAEQQAMAEIQRNEAKQKIAVAGRIPDPSQMPPDLRKLTR